MGIVESIILGLVQGLTEFLPVSSSGHLVLAEKILGLSPGNLRFEVAMHLATLLAVFAIFGKRILKIARALLIGRMKLTDEGWRFSDENLRLALLLILATVPAALAGILFDDLIEKAFANPLAVSLALLATGGILFGTGRVPRGRGTFNWRNSLLVGMAQALAILPGISRSGSTIATGIYTGVDQERAAEFSFLLSIPVILGAGLLEFRKISLEGLHSAELASILAGGVAAAASGFLAIKLLLRLVRHSKLQYFAYYCWAAGLASLAWLLLAS